MDLKLRNVMPEDIDLLFHWANDPVVRQNSFNTAPIPYEDHIKWFHKMLADENAYQYILCDSDKAVGQIRLNIENGSAWIDYSVAPDMRGMGLGYRMLLLVSDQVHADRLKIHQLIGKVKYSNAASARAFEKCGYSKTDTGSCMEYRLTVARD